MTGPSAAASAENAFAKDLFHGLPARYDALAEILSFWQNARWRAELVARISASEPKRILDVATGTAGVALALARRTGADVSGIDISESMLARGRERVRNAGLDDRVSFTYLLRYVHDPAETLAELARVVRPGGVLASLDFFVPQNPAWRAAWWLYTRIALPAAGWVLGGSEWWRVGRFLGPNISNFYRAWPLERVVEAWNAAGLVDVGHKSMSVGGGIVMWGRKPDA